MIEQPIYNTDTCHCTAFDDKQGICPLGNCYRFWLYSELCRRVRNGTAPEQPIPYVPMSYEQGKCPNYIPIKR